MTGMLGVLAAHLYDLRSHSCACMEKRLNPPHLGFKKHAAHQAEELAAAGFGDVREQAAKLEAVRALHRGNRWGCCEACSEHIDIPMPCPTRAALEPTP